MKTFSRILSFVRAILLLAACAPKATEAPVFQGDNPYAPQPGDNELMIGDITVDSSSVVIAKSQPPQVMVNFAYFQPTPCYQLRVEVSGPDDQNQISLNGDQTGEFDS